MEAKSESPRNPLPVALPIGRDSARLLLGGRGREGVLEKLREAVVGSEGVLVELLVVGLELMWRRRGA